jgi:hypothetical protein
LKRPKTVLEQYKQATFEAMRDHQDWLLITDDDARLINYPKYNYENFNYDFVSFYWIDAPKIFNRNYFGIGLYRVRVLKHLIYNGYLTSEGLDLVLQKRMKTDYSQFYSYTHNSKLTMKRMFRYGKGRAYFNRQTNTIGLPSTGKTDIKNTKYYFAYFLGLVSGHIFRMRDQTW